ncbi:Plasmodium variant antigen protein Cir/Yir/Bir, putative, partial [Plasmodium chabaudi adami]
MPNPSYNIEDVYKEFVTISGYFYEDENDGTKTQVTNGAIHNYCHYEDKSGNGKCSDYFQMTSSGVIHLLEKLKKYGLDDDKLAEYAILWLIYKLNIKEKDKLTDLNKFYTDHIEKNKCYNDNINGDGSNYKDIINKKINLMDMNIKEIFKLEPPFNILYYLYYVTRDDQNSFCTEYSKYATKFADQFNGLNNDSNNIKDSSFSQILSTLLNDHNNLINKYGNKCPNFQPLPELTPKKSSAEKSAKGGEQITLQNPEATPSSSSILNTVIPVLSAFAIPVFLGVAYKYSLFGFDKLFQRQYIRKKLKK